MLSIGFVISIVLASSGHYSEPECACIAIVSDRACSGTGRTWAYRHHVGACSQYQFMRRGRRVQQLHAGQFYGSATDWWRGGFHGSNGVGPNSSEVVQRSQLFLSERPGNSSKCGGRCASLVDHRARADAASATHSTICEFGEASKGASRPVCRHGLR
jgi:hypothetical protein